MLNNTIIFYMKMTTKGKYAVSIMCELADSYSGNSAKFLQAKDISKKHFLSVLYAEQILNRLKKAGLIKAYRGPSGGYRLTKHPEEIKVGQIIEASEGPISLVECVTENSGGKCKMTGKCKTKKFWFNLNRVIENLLDNTSLADICRDN
jgi:Rrf2 family protein